MKKLIILVCFCVFITVLGTDRKVLESQRKAKLEEINETLKILRQTSSKKNGSLKELRVIQNLIKVRQEIIEDLANEVNEVEKESENKSLELKALNMHLVNQKEKYGSSLAKTYRLKNCTGNNWHFIFSSRDFNQLLVRFSYLRKITDYQKNIIQTIEQDKIAIETGLIYLGTLKEQKQTILSSKEEERQKLEGDKDLQQKTVNSLVGQEVELRKKLAAQKAAKAKLDNEIERLIRIELEKARKRQEYDNLMVKGDGYFNKSDYQKAIDAYQKAADLKVNTTAAKAKITKAKQALAKQNAAKTEPKNEPQTKTEPAVKPEPILVSTPESNAPLTGNFANVKGRLPWPTANGFISEAFGTHAHPTISGVTINNNGVNIMTTSGAMARSVFEGTVVAVMEIPGMQNMVMVSHGDYFTVYAKLTTVFVKQGEKINAKTNIGKIYTNENDATELHFELWHNQVKQNPTVWLSKK